MPKAISQMKSKIRMAVSRAMKERVFPGCVVGVVWKNGDRRVWPFGKYTYRTNSSRVKQDTIYDVASLTKSLCTASVGLKLLELKKIYLEDRVFLYIPELRTRYYSDIRIKHLFTHTLDYNFSLASLKKYPQSAIIDALYSHQFKKKPGRVFRYANATSVLLGKVIENATHLKLPTLANAYLFQPLEMKRTLFYPLQRYSKNMIVPTEIDSWRNREIQGEVQDESAFLLQRAFGAVGSAGLFSCAPDVLNFLEMLIQDGEFHKRRVFMPATIRSMHSNQIKHLGLSTGFGWELNQREWMGRYVSRQTFGKTGFTGCSCVVDPVRGIGLVILSNMTYPDRHVSVDMKNAFRREVADIVFRQ